MADTGRLKAAFRILNWASVAALLVVLVLILHKAPPPKVSYDANAGARVEQKFTAADQAHASGFPAHVQIDSTELNSYLNQNLQLADTPQSIPAEAVGSQITRPSAQVASSATSNDSPAVPPALNSGSDQPNLEQVQSSVKDVSIDMDGDLIKAYVVFDFHGKDLSLELDGHLTTQDGYLKFNPVAGKLGSLPLPQSTLDAAVSRLMDSPENREKLRLPDDIDDVQISGGQAIVSYK